MYRMLILFHMLALLLLVGCVSSEKVMLDEDFSAMPRGPLGTDAGAHTEYHYIAEARPQTHWAVSTFRYNLPASWVVREINSQRFLVQTAINPDKHWHPMVVAGSGLWTDYSVEVVFKPEENLRRNGIAFRYLHDRCYYFAGIENDSLRLLRVNHEKAFRLPDEVVLASVPNPFSSTDTISLTVKMVGNHLEVVGLGRKLLEASDTMFTNGKIALLSDSPARFFSVKVTTSEADAKKIAEREQLLLSEEMELMASNPAMVVYKKISLDNFGVGRNLRFGDLDGNGEIDVLAGQVVHYGPTDRNSELSCLTAITLDGRVLWQTGKPDTWKTSLTNDVAFQIHDIDNDGKQEVIYCMNQEIIITEGATGKVLRKAPTPLTPGGKSLPSGHNIFPRILGDCILFCDLQGKGYNSDFILKDRYNYLWAYDANLNVLWTNECRTGHYPYAFDVDGDGKQEIATGYSLFSADGKKLWSLDSMLCDHADGVAIVQLNKNEAPQFLCAASDEGMFFASTNGDIQKHHRIGHVQNPAVANFRNDLPGLETVSVNFWANQGIIHLFDAAGEIYHHFEPNQYGSMCLPLNWSGSGEELVVLNANAAEGGAWDGYGRKALAFPDDGHPDMCYAVLDITGDCRDEIVVWNTKELWVYTQADNPKTGKLYFPKRNPLYNYSNYQATVSLPGWKTEP